MLRDFTGYLLTCGDEKALKSFNDGATAIVTLRENGFPKLVEAAKLDGSLIIARCVIVRTLNLYFEALPGFILCLHIDYVLLGRTGATDVFKWYVIKKNLCGHMVLLIDTPVFLTTPPPTRTYKHNVIPP